MIQSAISIRVKGQIYRYVRDVVTASPGGITGVGAQYYAYRGNARQKLNLTQNSLNYSMDTGLRPGVNYDFNITTRDLVETTFSVMLKPMDPLKPITYFDLIKALNKVSPAFRVEFLDADKTEEGIYFISNEKEAATSITVADGPANNLFASLNHFDSIGALLVSDNLYDQTVSAGQILFDLGTLTTQLEAVNIDDVPMLTFPESGGDTGMLIRDSHEMKGGLVFNQILRKSIDGFNIVETVKNVREGYVG